MDDDLDPLKRPRHPAREPDAEWLAPPPEPAVPSPSHGSEPGDAQAADPEAPGAAAVAEPEAAPPASRQARFVAVPTPQRSPLRWGIAAGILTAGALLGAAWWVMDINRHSALLESIARDVQVPLNAPRTAAEADTPAAAEPSAQTGATIRAATQPVQKAAAAPSPAAKPTVPARPPVKPAAAPDPQTACGHRTPFWTAVCLQSRCATDTYRAHASCVQLRRQEEQRRLDRELGG
jgi:hypothetical protein